MLTKGLLTAMLKRAAGNIAAEHTALSELDARTGDGDHGVTINRAMTAVVAALDENAGKPLAQLLNAVAMRIMMCDGGSTGPLLGSYFMGMAMKVPSDTLSAEETACMFESALNNFSGISRAKPGDKTMMDALVPATAVLCESLRGGGSLATAFASAAKAAAEGAEATRNYVAKFGRARTMGERAIGHCDPGAMSISHIFRGFAEASV